MTPTAPARYALGLHAVTEHTGVNTTSGITVQPGEIPENEEDKRQGDYLKKTGSWY